VYSTRSCPCSSHKNRRSKACILASAFTVLLGSVSQKTMQYQSFH
jgi:hypothetical protein